MDVQSAFHSLECPYGVPDGLGIYAVGEADCRCRHAVLDIDPSRSPAFHVFYHAAGVDEVEAEVAEIVRMRIPCVEVGVAVIVMISQDFRLRVFRGDVESELGDDRAVYLRRECLEGFQHVADVVVDVKRVGVNCRDDSDFRVQLEE